MNPEVTLPEHVITLHGWGMTGFVTRYWNSRLRQAGFLTSPFSYRSLSRTLDANVAQLAACLRKLPEDASVHLVGHSLGGIIIMQCLSQHHFANLGRVVMVGTPFQGSNAARRLESRELGRWMLGKTIVQWRGVEQTQLPSGLEVGTIAGTVPYGMGRLFGGLRPPHDGTVSVAETHVPFATDRLILRVTHTEMLLSSAVTHQIAQFLRHGKFDHGLRHS